MASKYNTSKDRKPSGKQIIKIGRLLAETGAVKVKWPENSREASKIQAQLHGWEDKGFGSETNSPTIKQLYSITSGLLKKNRKKWPASSSSASTLIQRLSS